MKKIRLYSIPALVLFAVASLLFAYLLFSSQLFPYRLGVIACAAIFVLIMLTSLLSTSKKSRILVIIGTVISLLFSLLLLLASFMVIRGVNTAQRITATKTEVSAIGVYMRADETTDTTELTAEMTYGILSVQDRENTDVVIDRLNQELGKEIQTKTYDGLSVLVTALFNKEVDAIILNSAFIDILDGMEGFEDVSTRLREVKKTHVENEVETQSEEKPKFKLPFFNANTSNNKKESIKPFALYISGIDSRVGLIEMSRCDVNIIAVVNPETHQILLVTTPRDYYVPLSISYGIPDKLTHAGMYGVNVSVETLEMLYDIDIDYYFRVNFEGFEDIIDALGGITVYNKRSFYSEKFYINFPEGNLNLNGESALAFVRERYSIGDSGRAQNQMTVIKAVIEKAVSTDALLNFSKLLSSIEGSFETTMPYDMISALVRDQIENGGDWNIVKYAVKGEGNSMIPYSMDIPVYVSVPIQSTVDTAKDLMQQVYDGKVISEPVE